MTFKEKRFLKFTEKNETRFFFTWVHHIPHLHQTYPPKKAFLFQKNKKFNNSCKNTPDISYNGIHFEQFFTEFPSNVSGGTPTTSGNLSVIFISSSISCSFSSTKKEHSNSGGKVRKTIINQRLKTFWPLFGALPFFYQQNTPKFWQKKKHGKAHTYCLPFLRQGYVILNFKNKIFLTYSEKTISFVAMSESYQKLD